MIARRVCLAIAILAVLVVSVDADLYLMNPRGSNNRLNEQSAQRASNNRLYDSQDNARGGFNVGDRGANRAANTATAYDHAMSPSSATFDASQWDQDYQYQMVYYEGSEFTIEWTNQHGCGGNEASDPQKTNCDLVIQYMCQTSDGGVTGTGASTRHKTPPPPIIPGAENIRDGLVTDPPIEWNSNSDFDVINQNVNQHRGHHESEMYYYECTKRSRNLGLFTADQRLSGKTAKYTRQNKGGNKSGLECPEERDYYPYWSPSPWRDVAILTDHAERDCDENGKYKGASQNNHNVYKCVATDPTATTATAILNAITEKDCVDAGGAWTAYTHGIEAPDCMQAPWSRANHLGNGRNGQPLHYNWTLPTISTLEGSGVHMFEVDGAKYARCVLRMRYNISTDDYDPYNTTSASNRWKGIVSPVENNPTVDIGAGFEGIQLAVNTAQFGRTFQDRSHVFYIRSRPTTIPPEAKIYNLNVRGKRGNIVQTFPATEYDFMPTRLQVKKGDYVHVQWTGSNTHKNGNPAGDGQDGDAGEGKEATDRHNMCQLLDFSQNYCMPLDVFQDNMWTNSRCFKLDGSPLSTLPSTPGKSFAENPAALDCSIYMTTSGYWRSAARVNEVAADPTIDEAFDPLLNNAPASLIGGVVMQFEPEFAEGQTSKSYDYICTRNNNFSNRGQKATIVVVP